MSSAALIAAFDNLWLGFICLGMVRGWVMWCCCDVTETTECVNCIDDQAPLQFQVELSGVADDLCSNCGTNHDGTYVVDTAGTGTCGWNWTGSNGETYSLVGTVGCKAAVSSSVILDLLHEFGTLYLDVEFSVSSAFGQDETHRFRNVQLSDVDCMNLSAYGMTYRDRTESGQVGYACDFSGATVTVTTI